MIPEAPDVSVIVVSYNGKEILRDCLKSIFDQTEGINFEVIVSDNGSDDGSPEMVEKLFPSVMLIKNGANLGFARANNVALPCCGGRYILLLNPDTVVLSNAIGAMVKFMDKHSQIGACGPKLLNSDGSLQYSVRNFPSITNQLAESLFLHKIFPGLAGFGELITGPSFYREARMVDWVVGAALMMRREALNDVGPLDERYFMYSEDKDWCFNAWQKGWPIMLIPEAKIIHLHGESSTNPQLFSMMVNSKKLFLRKNFAPAKAGAIIAIMRLNLALRIGLSKFAKLLGPKLAMRAANKLEVSQVGRHNLKV
ncbi:MAG: glycosyltransferase family 2 protein [Actinobacteria bacterium]|nr:glycosyltransferase family 2 protein [Actinomycetota bacterium]